MIDIKRIGVIGAGTMGNGIAHVFSVFNYDVILVDVKRDILKSALSIIKNNMNRQLNKGLISKSKVKSSISNIKLSTNIDDLSNCDIIIEAIKEDFKIKSDLFIKLDKVCNENTILASNTSSISINELANSTKRPEKVIGMHFMNPVPVMKLVEIIQCKKTSKETSNIINEISKKINKIPVICNDSPGFVSNRILMPMINEAVHCYSEKVATAESIDSIMKLGMGHPMGPLKLADLIGVDVCVYIMNVLYDGFKNEKYKPSSLLVEMVSNNKLGKKTGEGFYKYEI